MTPASGSTRSTRATGCRSTLTELDLDQLEGIDAAIVAYPHGAAAPTVAALRAADVLVVDLSADFRLRDLATYERWYGEHGAPALFGTGVYGLTEIYREELREATLVATPGCYPTASVLGLAPLAEKGLVTDVSIAAMQGTSGYGRSSDDLVHFSAMTENAFPYKTEGHRHRPEIEQELEALGSQATVAFVPHLLPLDQGELATCFATLAEPTSKEAVLGALPRALRRGALRPPARRAAEPAGAARHQRVPRLRHGRGARQGDGLLGDRQHLEGRLQPGRAEPQPDAGAGRDGGAAVSVLGAPSVHGEAFFRSRWVDAPRGCRGARPRSAAPGFRAGGAHCGLKKGGETDVGVIACDAAEVSARRWS